MITQQEPLTVTGESKSGGDSYEAQVRFGTRVQVWVRDSAIFEKGGCGAAGLGNQKIIKNIFNILLSILFHII